MAKAIIGLDYGRARIGVAVARQHGGQPGRLTTLPNNNDGLLALKSLIQNSQVKTVVLGLPRGIEGNETAQSSEVRAFGDQLEALMKVHVKYQDEFATSQLARDRLKSQGRTEEQLKPLLDQEAAVIILEDYLAQQ